MDCKVCGATLREDQMYCPQCGEEIHLVQFYNPSDDFLGVDMDVVNPKKNSPLTGDANEQPLENANKTKRISKKTIAIILSALIVVGIAIICICINVVHKNDYNYQLNKANALLSMQNYENGASFALQATKLNKESVEARWVLVECYKGMNNYDLIMPVLSEIFELESYDSEVMIQGIEIFTAVGDYHHAANVLELTTDKKFRNKYKEYISSQPEFSFEDGNYDHDLQLEIKCEGKGKIYYVIDGDDPEKGSIYKGPVWIKAGEHTVRAVFINELGVKSDERSASFIINPDAPDMPEINKPSGDIRIDETIEISGPSGCKLYYTWDGSEPSAQSEEYTGPLTAPAGNNILSVVAVDSYGQVSGIARKNFIGIENVEE